ncbi:hypothetical protein D3C76_1399650 [compost metagenome]
MNKKGLIVSMIIIALVAIGFIKYYSDSKKEDLNINLRGIVKNITLTSKGANIFVEGSIESDTQYDKASLTINSDTEIIRNSSNTKSNISDIKQGDKVEVYFIGPVAESYPVQAVAGIIKILD